MPAAVLQHKTMPGLRAADARARQAVALLITCTVIQRWERLLCLLVSYMTLAGSGVSRSVSCKTSPLQYTSAGTRDVTAKTVVQVSQPQCEPSLSAAS